MIQTYDGCDAQTPLGVLYRLVLVTQYSPLLAAQLSSSQFSLQPTRAVKEPSRSFKQAL